MTNHVILMFGCILSIEIFLRLNFLSHLNTILNSVRKVLQLVSSKNISDHWKEKVILTYAIIMMKASGKILLISLCISLFFLFNNLFFNGFLEFAISIFGIIESIFFLIGYFYLRKLALR